MEWLSEGLAAFELHEMLGAGGMGRVYRATHRRSGTDVALKVNVLSGNKAQRKELFLREARAMAGVDHPGIVRILALGELADDDGEQGLRRGDPFIAMEFADAGALAKDGIQNWPDLRDLLRQMLDALAHAHARDIVHLDLKPDNILKFAAKGGLWRYRITDFGVAATLTRQVARTNVSGTPLYMAPEQVLGEWRQFGPWTDLYALAGVVWELATGGPPFRRDTPIMTFMAHVKAELPEFVPRFTVPKALESWLRVCLRKSPRERFTNAADAAAALEQLAREATDVHTAADAPPAIATPTTAALRQTIAEAPAETLVIHGTIEAERANESQRTNLPVAPASEHWREPARADERLSDAGLGLFAFRSFPIVGATEQRAALWSGYLTARTEERPRHLHVEGRAGSGKSKLLDWYVRRLRELGQAATVVVAQGDHVAWHGAFRAMLIDLLRARSIEPTEMQGRIDDVLPGLDQEHASTIASVIDDGALGSERDVFALLDEIVRILSHERPLVVVFDGIENEPFALEYVEHALGELDDAVVFVTSCDSDDSRTQVVERLSRLEPTIIELVPMHGAALVDYVRSLLPLDAATTEYLTALADGALVRHTLTGWIELGQLAATDDGLTARSGSEWKTVADVLFARLEAAVVKDSAASIDDAVHVGTLLAAVGMRVGEGRLQEVAAATGIDVPHEVVEVLESLAVVSRDDGAFQFTDRATRRAFLELGRRSGRLNRTDRALAERLLEGSRSERERAAHHLYRAGDVVGAIEAGRRVVQMSFGRDGDSVFQWMESIAAESTDPEVHRAMTLTRIRQGLHRVHTGDQEGAAACLEQAAADLEAEPDEELEAELLYVRATEALFATRYEEGLALLAHVFDWFGEHGTPRNVAECHALRGDLYMYSGRFDEAESDYRQSLEFWAESEDSGGHAWALYRLGSLADERGDFAMTDAFLGQALDIFRELEDRNGSMLCKDIMALSAYRAGRYERARSLWTDVLKMATAADDQGRFLAHENLGRLAAQAGDPHTAIEHFRHVEAEFERSGYSICVAWFWDALAEACARVGDWRRVVEALQRGIDDLEHADLHSADLFPTLRRIEGFAQEAEEDGVSRLVADALRRVETLRSQEDAPV